ncbi:Clp protease N-terminal domain-containing protein [Frankia sp. AgKG'84/4]|uniref:Clp protease N-terminal domain-containing protein n=1 Tax=Frankia sp. AgKG'84/4 TaxID=573490 RepID=UPI00200F3AAB|nr:Clp protease N-terminal domain-containing protein [Frankia sp. AgKG'84/4]MCL9793085.1 Clp protease N-terminal domain-containing protein [Frankia sp. AgKG'84/4]
MAGPPRPTVNLERTGLGHHYVGTEHILLAQLAFEDGSGLLTDLGLDRSAVEAQVASAQAPIAGSDA